MKNTNKKGFTIVELVIVIAVIAVLSAIMIPTFGSIIESANRTNDTVLVANINTILAAEDFLDGGVNEVVDIQNLIKANGLKLETKSKGAYLWYDRDSGKVVLGSLDENNNLKVISGGTAGNNTANVDANGPVLLSNVTNQVDPLKGKFDINMISLEGFIHGYYFISEKSSDGFAEKICAVRNSDSEDALRNALRGVSAANSSVGQQFTVFMNTHPLITSSDVIFLGTDKSKATTAIVGGGVTEIVASVIAKLGEYTNIDHIDLHPGVTKVDNSALTVTEGILYFHSIPEVNEEIDKYREDNEIEHKNVLLKGERDKYIKTLNLVYRDTAGNILESASGNNPELNKTKWKVTLMPWLESPVAGTADKVYDFVGYSFEDNGSAVSITLGTSNHFLTEAEKTKVNESTGAITIYAVYEVDTTPDFKVTVGDTENYYGSRAMTYKLSIGAIQSGNIVVCSTDAVLDASLIGLADAKLNIPSGVTLWVPCTTTDTDQKREKGLYQPVFNISKDVNYDWELNKDTIEGKYRLTIDDSITLINKGYITVDAELYKYQNFQQGFIGANSGVMILNGQIINENGGRIEAYGIIKRGAGNETGGIEVKSGSTILELMSVLDMYGGSSTSIAVAGSKGYYSPFNLFTVDSVRLPVTVQYGAVYTTYGTMIANNVGNQLEFKIAASTGNPNKADESNPLFKMNSTDAKIVKSYVEGEGIKIDIYGDVVDCKKKVEAMGYGVDFSKIPMPLPNFDVRVMSGASLTLSQMTYKVLPGSDWIVEKGGTLNVNCKMIVYDSFELEPEDSSKAKPERTYTRTNSEGEVVSKFTDFSASLLVRGTLNLQGNAQFAGKVLGDVNDAHTEDKGTIIVHQSAKTTSDDNISPIVEGWGAYGTITILGKPVTNLLDPKWNAFNVTGFDWTGRFQTDIGTYTEIPDSDTTVTYKFTGGIWE